VPRAHETALPVDGAAPEIGPEVATPPRHPEEVAVGISDCMAPCSRRYPG
jgi:hypothetical protein